MQQLFPNYVDKRNNNYLLLIICLLIILLVVMFVRQLYLPFNSNSEEKLVFNIAKGQGLEDISSNLKEQGLIDSNFFFYLGAVLKRVEGKLQAGTYYLSPSMNIMKILSKISTGDVIKENLTIIEGWSLRDIAWHFETKGMFQAEEILEVTGFPAVYPTYPRDFSEEFSFLKEKPANVSLEGYLFPDTYEIGSKDGVEDIIRKLLDNFDKKVSNELRQRIKNQGRTLFQVLTMASMLEKEVKEYEDKQIAAGILWKRLNNGWPLQVDACLTYLTGKPSENLTKDDLNIDSHYNSYKYYGLPLGPICNPGLESLEAAVYYIDSDYWFYLTTNDDKTIFSKTLEEHAANRVKYLK